MCPHPSRARQPSSWPRERLSPRSGREACAPSPPPKCRGAEVLGGRPVPPGLGAVATGCACRCSRPARRLLLAGRWLVPQRPAVRSRCSSGGDSHELSDARCLHDQAADARRSPAPLQRLPLLLGQGCAGRVAPGAGVVNLTQVAGGCGQRREGATCGAHARAANRSRC